MLHARTKGPALAVVLAALAIASVASAEPLGRSGDDAREVAWLDQTYPDAGMKLREGEDVLGHAKTRSDLEKAAALFDQAEQLGAGSGIIPRRQCQALTALGRRLEAIDACTRSIKVHPRSAGTLRAAVAARVAGPERPGTTDLGFALQYARDATKMMDTATLGYAGRCDIAAALGDTDMLNACIRELERVGPDDYETERAHALAAAVRPGLETLSVWIGLLALVVGTVCHALFGNRRRLSVAAALPVLFALALRAEPCHAADDGAGAAVEDGEHGEKPGELHGSAGHMSKFAIDDENPEASVPSAAQRDEDPIQYGYFIMDLGDHAEWAIQKDDHLKAARLYRALAKAVPDASVGFTKACEQFELAGDLNEAKNLCAAALTVKGASLADYGHYVRLVLSQKKVPAPELANLDAAVKHLTANDATRSAGLEIECTIGAHEADRARLEHCVPRLLAEAPGGFKPLYYAWALAITKHDYAAAEHLVEKLRKASAAAPDDVKKIEKATLEAMPAWRKGLHAFRDWRVGALTSVVLFSGLALIVMRRRPVYGEP